MVTETGSRTDSSRSEDGLDGLPEAAADFLEFAEDGVVAERTGRFAEDWHQQKRSRRLLEEPHRSTPRCCSLHGIWMDTARAVESVCVEFRRKLSLGSGDREAAMATFAGRESMDLRMDGAFEGRRRAASFTASGERGMWRGAGAAEVFGGAGADSMTAAPSEMMEEGTGARGCGRRGCGRSGRGR